MLDVQKEEKKVEFLELIYDLIFVYIIGRNNSLLHHVTDGFVSGGVFMGYVFCTLAIIQIWNYSTFYINVYGKNSVRDHIFLFINMYLLYYMADGTNVHWQSSVYRYNIAWALILVNIAVQHIMECCRRKQAPWEQKQLRHKSAIILIEAVLVVGILLLYRFTGVMAPYIPIAFGIAAMMVSGRFHALVPIDFMHLTERAMLYVVFTFGEMIIAIASYFSGALSRNTVYFSAMGFLIVVGLFLSYGTIYNHILDRERTTDGTGYMLVHVFLIFALNNISVALEFMREAEVELLPKTLFLTGSLILYLGCLFLTGFWAKTRCVFHLPFILLLAGSAVLFAVLMFVLRRYMYINIALTVVYVFGIFLILYRHGKQIRAKTTAYA